MVLFSVVVFFVCVFLVFFFFFNKKPHLGITTFLKQKKPKFSLQVTFSGRKQRQFLCFLAVRKFSLIQIQKQVSSSLTKHVQSHQH